ncbi:MAG: hypothetical protein QOI08_2386 [Actinomycetota bacterium]|jgi:hypothetical protein|nr:hypothetical protein [Actinomycetota bacterium]
MQQDEAGRWPLDREPWVHELRGRFVDSGHDQREVDAVITATLGRFRSARLQSFLPILIERSVQRALREKREPGTGPPGSRLG